MQKITLVSLALMLVLASFGQNKKISNGLIFDGEPYIVINPANSHHMVVAWMSFVPGKNISIKTTVSLNAGESWSTPAVVSHTNPQFGSADPSLGFNNSGEVFLAYIDFSRALDSGYIYVRKSQDGGLSWGQPKEVIDMHAETNKLAIDRPWIAIDNSGQSTSGNIYVTSMNAEGATPSFNPYFISSTDGGNSFNQWRHLDTTGYLSGSLIPKPMPTPVVSSNGTFHAVFPSYVPSQALLPKYFLASSKNGGLGFSYKTVIASSITFNDSLAKKGYLLKSDPSDPDHLAYFFLYSPNGDADVYMTESFDEGVNWTPPQRINDDPIANNRMQDLLWADFDQDGDLIVAWRDRRNATNETYQTETEIWAAFKRKDSSAFEPNFRLSDTKVSFDSVLNESGNDFISLQLMDDTLSAVWGDTRSGFLSIWFQRMTVEGKLVGVKRLNSDRSISVYPNPVKDHLRIEGTSIQTVEVYDNRGKLISLKEFNGISTVSISLQSFKSGFYLLRVSDNDGERVVRVLKE